ncbi:hypothetical protein AVEN_37744-1 [Araneus ventricosus]|uniref:Uncharacterized protein n=1 Tax=Araneus ventricosus TaxID=182803 RepID=A0A4Y2BW03_ARAVE|nr:hypothetical protein AVEN_37744-1 [Araneus ventricosus]
MRKCFVSMATLRLEPGALYLGLPYVRIFKISGFWLRLGKSHAFEKADAIPPIEENLLFTSTVDEKVDEPLSLPSAAPVQAEN